MLWIPWESYPCVKAWHGTSRPMISSSDVRLGLCLMNERKITKCPCEQSSYTSSYFRPNSTKDFVLHNCREVMLCLCQFWRDEKVRMVKRHQYRLLLSMCHWKPGRTYRGLHRRKSQDVNTRPIRWYSEVILKICTGHSLAFLGLFLYWIYICTLHSRVRNICDGRRTSHGTVLYWHTRFYTIIQFPGIWP